VTEQKILTLRDCKEGDRAKIKKVRKGPLEKRLREMGFVLGAEIEIVKYAPLKDPIELIIKNYHLSLRRDEAEWIEVESLTEQIS